MRSPWFPSVLGAVPLLVMVCVSEALAWLKRRRARRRPDPCAVEAGAERTKFWSLEQRRDT